MAIFSLYWPKKSSFATRGKNTHFWNRKCGQTWSKLYLAMCFDTYLHMKIVYSGLVIGQKKLFLPPEVQNMQFKTVNMIKNRTNSSILFIFILALRKILFSRLITILMPFLAIYCQTRLDCFYVTAMLSWG